MGLLLELYQEPRPLDMRRLMSKRHRRPPRRTTTFSPANVRAIKEMLLKGVPLHDVALDFNTTVNSIRATFSKLHIDLPSSEDGSLRKVIRLSETAAHVMKVEAEYRGIKPVELIERLLDAIAMDKLFDAVLDK